MKRGVSCLLIAMTAVCLNLKDVRDAECGVACRREGAQAGYYVDKTDTCACVNYYSYKKATRKVPMLNRMDTNPVQESDIYVKSPKEFGDE